MLCLFYNKLLSYTAAVKANMNRLTTTYFPTSAFVHFITSLVAFRPAEKQYLRSFLYVSTLVPCFWLLLKYLHPSWRHQQLVVLVSTGKNKSVEQKEKKLKLHKMKTEIHSNAVAIKYTYVFKLSV